MVRSDPYDLPIPSIQIQHSCTIVVAKYANVLAPQNFPHLRVDRPDRPTTYKIYVLSSKDVEGLRSCESNGLLPSSMMVRVM